ncbi:MAG: hypothetical protein ABI867_37155, partial [Kofleriaceae bacterium]
ERAVPVLQHAQNLDPTSPQILSMLRRARAGQPLDPPNPVPQPIAPRGETGADRPIVPTRSNNPTAHAKPRSGPPQAPQFMPVAQPMMPTMALEPAPPPPPRSQRPEAPSFPEASSPHGYAQTQPAQSRNLPKQTAPPPMSVEGVKPRIIASEKEKNAAAASLRQSAAVGENYLNELLTGGLLDVAGVRVPDADYDLRPDRRWGRSTRRAFIFLFVVLVLGIGGGGTWYWWTAKQQSEAVAILHRESKTALYKGDYTGVVESLKKLQEAIAKDSSDKLTYAYYIEAAGLGVLLYGETRIPSPEDPTKEVPVGPDQVDAAFKSITAGEDVIVAGQPGWREMQIGKVALELSRLPVGSVKPEVIKAGSEKLGEVNKTLDDLLGKNAEDKWARWLKGRAMQAAGDRRGAITAFKAASEGDDGVVVALIDHANLLVDDGKTDDALGLFKKALDRSKDHPLGVIGQALAKAEASIGIDEVIGDLNAKFQIDKLPSRVAAYRWLALATASITSDDYKAAAEAIGKSTLLKPPPEPRFWARVAWVHYKLGRPAKTGTEKQKSDLAAAELARANCIFFTAKADPDPVMQLVDAGLLLAEGRAEKVVDVASKLEGERPKLLRTYALIDLGKAKEAQTLAEEILKGSSGSTGATCEGDNKLANLEARVLCEQARMLWNDKERLKASESMANLASASKNQIPRHALGVAYLLLKDAPVIDAKTGSNLDNAKKYLKRAVDEIKEEEPNPLVYRTYTSLAEIALLEKDVDAAEKLLDQSFDVNSGYYPMRAMQARVKLRKNDPEGALTLIEPLLKDKTSVTPPLLLTYAEVLVVKKGSGVKDKDQATAILKELKDKPGIANEELGRVAAMIDPKLPEEIGVPVPDDGKKVEKEPKPPKRRGR